MVVEWLFRENGAETIYGFIQRLLLSFEMCFKVMYRSKWAVSSKHMIEQTPFNVKKVKNNKLIKWPPSVVFSSYLVIFPATLFPIILSEWVRHLV